MSHSKSYQRKLRFHVKSHHVMVVSNPFEKNRPIIRQPFQRTASFTTLREHPGHENAAVPHSALMSWSISLVSVTCLPNSACGVIVNPADMSIRTDAMRFSSMRTQMARGSAISSKVSQRRLLYCLGTRAYAHVTSTPLSRYF